MLFGSPAILFTLNFVSCANCLQFRVFNLLGLTVKHFNQSRHHIVERHDLLEEVNALRLHVLGVTVLLGWQHANLVVFIEGDVHIDFGVHCNIEL